MSFNSEVPRLGTSFANRLSLLTVDEFRAVCKGMTADGTEVKIGRLKKPDFIKICSNLGAGTSIRDMLEDVLSAKEAKILNQNQDRRDQRQNQRIEQEEIASIRRKLKDVFKETARVAHKKAGSPNLDRASNKALWIQTGDDDKSEFLRLCTTDEVRAILVWKAA